MGMRNSLHYRGGIVLVQGYGTTAKSVRLETERENLNYVLSHAELTEQEQSYVRCRLNTVETEMLELLNSNYPDLAVEKSVGRA